MSTSSPLICLAPLAGLAIFIIIGFLVGAFAKKNYLYRVRINQNHGEATVRNTIVSSFRSSKYHLLNNITIPFQDGSTQIDHILISSKGVFVIETKTYSGWIFANAQSKQWTQVIYRVKNKFQNPVRQNFLHVKVVQQLLDFLPKEQIHSVVVFAGNGQFKTPMPKGVVYLNQLVEYLESFQDDIISVNRLEFCVGRLECRRYELTHKTDIQHQAYLAKKFGDM